MVGRGATAFSWGAGRWDLLEATGKATLRHRAWVDGALVVDEDLGGTLASAPTGRRCSRSSPTASSGTATGMG